MTDLVRTASFAVFLASLFFSTTSLAVADAHASLAGSPDARHAENAVADRRGLERFADVARLRHTIRNGGLVRIADTPAYAVDEKLGECDPSRRDLYRHARPYTKAFLDELLGEGFKRFGERYAITSLVRTRAYVRCLIGRNPNAISDSSHLTGATVDIGTLGLSAANKAWLRSALTAAEKAGRILATEERTAQACFHIMVLPTKGVAKKRVSRRH